MEQRAPQAAMGVASELAVTEGDVGALYGNVRDGEGLRDGAQQRCVADGDVGERGTRVEGEDQHRTDRVITNLMGKDPSARFRFIMDRADEALDLDV